MCFRENKIDLVGGLCDGEAMKLADHCHSVTAERWVREGGGGKGIDELSLCRLLALSQEMASNGSLFHCNCWVTGDDSGE